MKNIFSDLANNDPIASGNDVDFARFLEETGIYLKCPTHDSDDIEENKIQNGWWIL